jgi:phosphatidylglycerophosphate synthase
VAVVSGEWLSTKNRATALVGELEADIVAGRIRTVDAAKQQAYIPDMRRSVRPIFFPAPSPNCRPLAERLLRNATQKGVLDFPALVHALIEKWLVSHLCRTPITPNQITLVTGVFGLSVTVLYALGYLWPGALLALIIGVLDGLDGKLARLKVQMTKAGKEEHLLDYVVEMSWWIALAYHFHATGQVRYAYALLLAFLRLHFARTRRKRICSATSRSKLGRCFSIRSTCALCRGMPQHLHVAVHVLPCDWCPGKWLHLALSLGNGERRDPHLPRSTDSLHVPQQNSRSDHLIQARYAIADSSVT